MLVNPPDRIAIEYAAFLLSGMAFALALSTFWTVAGVALRTGASR